MTIQHTVASLLASAPCNRHDAEIILAHILKIKRADVIAFPEQTIDHHNVSLFKEYTQRRAANEPLAYIVGEKEFYGRVFNITQETLVPRPETEVLVERALAIAQNHIKKSPRKPLIIVDVGTGSGIIIVTLAAELATRYSDHMCGFIATDTNIDALTVAESNAQIFDVAEQIAFIHAPFISPLLKSEACMRILEHDAHLLICANLPYVDNASKETLLKRKESSGLAFEPQEALWSDDGGLAHYKMLFADIATLLERIQVPMHILCEIDPQQEKPLIKHVRNCITSQEQKYSLATQTHADLAGRPRVVEFAIKH